MTHSSFNEHAVIPDRAIQLGCWKHSTRVLQVVFQCTYEYQMFNWSKIFDNVGMEKSDFFTNQMSFNGGCWNRETLVQCHIGCQHLIINVLLQEKIERDKALKIACWYAETKWALWKYGRRRLCRTTSRDQSGHVEGKKQEEGLLIEQILLRMQIISSCYQKFIQMPTVIYLMITPKSNTT